MTAPASEPGPRHFPVLPAEVLHYLAPMPGEVWVDATTGTGGHARLLLEKLGPQGKLICVDQDQEMLAVARARLQGNVVFWQANFDQLRVVLAETQTDQVDG